MVNNFPLSHVIFKVNFPLSNEPLALVSAKRQQQRHNTGLSLKSTRLSSFFEFISHILVRIFGTHFGTLHGFLMLKFSTLTPKPNYNSGTLVRSCTPMIWCLSNARSRDLHFGTSFVALRALVREIIPYTIPTHPHTYIHDLTPISIDCLTPASRLRRSASV